MPSSRLLREQTVRSACTEGLLRESTDGQRDDENARLAAQIFFASAPLHLSLNFKKLLFKKLRMRRSTIEKYRYVRVFPAKAGKRKRNNWLHLLYLRQAATNRDVGHFFGQLWRFGMRNLIFITGFIAALSMSSNSFAEQGGRVQINRDNLQNTDDILKKYNDGKTLVFDLSEEDQKDEKKAVMTEVSGMVIGDNKVVYAKKGPQGTKFLVLEKQMRQDKQAKALEKFEATTPTATSEQQK